ncbi:hypothetical protein GBA52_019475 [Prunus armeniaca]|nr:hypothetical protein GBA52_019475 [Prunus armeniaca]
MKDMQQLDIERRDMQSLTKYLQTHRQVWNDNSIMDNYRRIIRSNILCQWINRGWIQIIYIYIYNIVNMYPFYMNIIHIFVELERYFERCDLDLEHLSIVDNEVQRSFQNYVQRSLRGRLCKLQCKFVLERILGKDDRIKELKNFYELKSKDILGLNLKIVCKTTHNKLQCFYCQEEQRSHCNKVHEGVVKY